MGSGGTVKRPNQLTWVSTDGNVVPFLPNNTSVDGNVTDPSSLLPVNVSLPISDGAFR